MKQMTLEDFNRLANGDRVTLVVALELLLQNGRNTIRREEPLKLVDACKGRIGGFFAEGALQEIVDVCRQLAALDTNILVDYIRRGHLDMKAPGEEEAGVCPVCGGELEYVDTIRSDNGGFAVWTCPDCGATGKEGYDKVFDQHYDVKDGDGKPFPAPAE